MSVHRDAFPFSFTAMIVTKRPYAGGVSILVTLQAYLLVNSSPTLIDFRSDT